MGNKKLLLDSILAVSRRSFLRRAAATPLFLQAGGLLPFIEAPSLLAHRMPEPAAPDSPFIYQPRYPLSSELDEVLRKIDPEHDEFPIEKYAARIKPVLAGWKASFLKGDFLAVQPYLGPGFKGVPILGTGERVLRSGPGLEIRQSAFVQNPQVSKDVFLSAFVEWSRSPGALTALEFKVAEATILNENPLRLRTVIRFRLAGGTDSGGKFQRSGRWQIGWNSDASGMKVESWSPMAEVLSLSRWPVFEEVTERALEGVHSYREQLIPGTTAWRTRLDGALGLDVYNNTGISVGDFDNDGFEDVYICQPSGLPNRLYRNRGDGTFEDVTETAGVDVLDSTTCALFADVNNNGRQDLLVVTASGPLLFVNQGNGRYHRKPDAFHFAQPPQGTFTGAAFADYDRDGRLDVYFCLYSYYRGLDQYQYPAPYYDAQNGPPNFLFHNESNWTFRDTTHDCGVNQNNNRYSFDCHWCDYDGDGWPDLYVVNDFGEKNLYHNHGDGTFSDVASEAGVLDIGPGMSGCWFDANNDGQMDLYVSDMWEAAGMRLSAQPGFLPRAPQRIRSLYRRHARGNSLFINQGNGKFKDQTAGAGAEQAGWSWSGFAWDFDHDGHADIYVATGMISGPDSNDLDSFFWRRVVAQSPVSGRPSRPYELGWNAVNEMIRSDGTWAGYEHNAFYCNHGDGTFSEVSGAVGLDFLDDSRAFALADLDHDGRLEVFLKGRSSPQVRLLRNAMADPAQALAIKLEGERSNRDAIGAIVRLKTSMGEQMKFVSCGSGFASQHTRELSFGLGASPGPVEATIQWPSGLIQHLRDLPRGHRIHVKEGRQGFSASPFASPPPAWLKGARIVAGQPLPARSETWLAAPLAAPDFALNDAWGKAFRLSATRGKPLLLFLWSIESPDCVSMLKDFQKALTGRGAKGIALAALSLDRDAAAARVAEMARRESYPFPLMVSTEQTAGIYNLAYRYLFDRHRNLALPVVFLLDREGSIVKVNQGRWSAAELIAAASHIPTTAEQRLSLALPFPGKAYGADFSRAYLTNAVAYAQHGYVQAAEEAFLLAIRQNPSSSLAEYSLGTLYLRNRQWEKAGHHLTRALTLRPDYGLCLTNLGVLAAQQGQFAKAEDYLRRALAVNPHDSLALQNLAEIYRQQNRWSDALQTLQQALQFDPENASLNYILGMVYADQRDNDHARQYLQRALELRPDFPEALNNLGVLEMLTGHPRAARQQFERCLGIDPGFDQPYVNLARIDVAEGRRADAISILKRLLERQPGNALAQKMLQRLQP
jgi:tetratricopeptide (TPR) repeat protein